MKYIAFECNGQVMPILFADHTDHSMIARCVKSEYPGYKVKSAGFAGRNGSVWGESVSLRVKSDVEDEFYIKRILGIDID